MPKLLQETARISEAAAAEAKATGKMLVQHISPGWGSSGYYASAVLEQAVADQVIPAGTHMYADHPTAAEAAERPVRSIKDLMSITTEDARLATDDDVARGAEIGALVSEVDVVPTYRPLVEHLKDAIGVSIRGDGEITEGGTAEGRTGRIVESLEHVQSVDWVTRAGRGGKVLSLVESAKATRRAVSRGISEATVNDTRDALQTALREAYAVQVTNGPNTYVWIRDFDDTTVWFEVDGAGDNTGLYGQGYAYADGVVTLTGDRAEVRVVTTYVPATRPDSTNPTTEESEEDTMGKISIEESEHSTLTEKAGRVDALLQENATKDQRIKELEEAEASRIRGDRAVQLIGERAKEADVEFNTLEQAGLLAALPLKEGALDEATFATRVDEQAALKKAGAGAVRGFGGAVTTPQLQEAEDFWGEIDTDLGIKKGA